MPDGEPEFALGTTAGVDALDIPSAFDPQVFVLLMRPSPTAFVVT